MNHFQGEKQGDPRMRVFFKKSHFIMPSGDAPLIMIGPGTGVAPFIGFCEERVHGSKKNEAALYFGC